MITVGSKQTMTVKELQQLLSTYPADMPVMATWEGVYASFKPIHFNIEWLKDVRVLTIDVEDYNA